MRTALKTLAATTLLALGLPALAEYPEKPVTIVVPFAAGGPTDKVARDLAESLRKPLGGTIVIENVGGAACHNGYPSCFYRKLVAGAKADEPASLKLELTARQVFDPATVYKKK